MEAQNYANHKRNVPMYGVLFLLIANTFIGSVVNVWQSWGDQERIYSASLIVVLDVCVLILFVFCRSFPMKAQDRAIRAEENLRHFVLAGTLLDPRLNLRQVIALRFASDAEFVALARRAAEEGLSADTIKRAIQNWRADTHRV